VVISRWERTPLQVVSHLGASQSVKVDLVICRRIALARRTVACSALKLEGFRIADALQRVYHRQNLRHCHNVQLVGTYV
jgi:hypothetical protein